MAVENYTVQYIADATSFVAGSRRVEQSLLAVEAQANKTKAAVSGFAGGGGRSATTAAKNVDKLAASLGAIPGAAGQATQALNGITVSSAGSSKGTGDLGQKIEQALLGFASYTTAVHVATKALHIFSQASEDAKKHLNEGAESGLDKRDKASTREYAGLLGKNQVDDDTMKGLFHLAQAGMMSFDKAVTFGSQFEGSVVAGKDKGHINAAQIAALKDETAAFAGRVGLDEKTAGDLGGVLPQYVDLKHDDQGRDLTDDQGVDKALGQLGALQKGLADGRGEISVLARKELAVAAGSIATGHVKDHAELGAFASVASTISSGQGSGTTYKRMSRLVNEGVGPGGDFLKRADVADKVGDFEKLKALKTHVDAQRAAAPDPKAFDAGKYLQAQGFGNDEEVQAAVGFMKEFEVLKTRRDNARKIAGDGQSVRAANQQFRASQSGQSRQAAAIQEAGNYEQTRKRQRLASARKAAYGQLQAEGKIDTFGANLTDGFLDATAGNLHTNTEHEARIDQRVWENGRAAARRAGIEKQIEAADPRFFDRTVKSGAAKGYGDPGYDGQDPHKLDEFLNTFGPQIEAKGVPINGSQVDVGVNPSTVKANPQPGGNAGGAPAGGAPGNAAAAPGAAPGGNKVATVDAPDVKKAGEMMVAAAQQMTAAARAMANGRGAPGGDLGGSYGPYRA